MGSFDSCNRLAWIYVLALLKCPLAAVVLCNNQANEFLPHQHLRDNYITLPRYLCHLWLVIQHCRLLCLLVSIPTCRVEPANWMQRQMTTQTLIDFIKNRQTICPNKSYPTMQQSKSQQIKNRNTPSTWGQWHTKTTLPNIMLQRGASSSKCWEHLSLDIQCHWDDMIRYRPIFLQPGGRNSTLLTVGWAIRVRVPSTTFRGPRISNGMWDGCSKLIIEAHQIAVENAVWHVDSRTCQI